MSRDLRAEDPPNRLVEIVDDDVTVLDPSGRSVGRFRELELELIDPAARPLLLTLLEQLSAAGISSEVPLPKYERALRIVAQHDA